MGVQVARWLRGASHSFRTLSGNHVNPLFIWTEALLLKAFSPAPVLLRLPAAIWVIAGLAATPFLYRSVYGNTLRGLLLTAATAALPSHIAYSRLGWDPSFVFFIAPFVLFPALRLAEAERDWRAIVLFAAGSFLAVWIHISSIVFVGLALGAVAGMRLYDSAVTLWKEPGFPKRRFWALIRAGALAVLLLAGFLAVHRVTGRNPRATCSAVTSSTLALVESPRDLQARTLEVGDFFSGQRGYEYLTGRPQTPATTAISFVCVLAFLGLCVYLLVRNPCRRADRCLGLLGLMAFPVVLILSPVMYGLQILGHERYVLWLAPLFSLVLMRSVLGDADGAAGKKRRAAGLAYLMLVSLALAGFWPSFFKALDRQTYCPTLHPTFLTGKDDPKTAAARQIRQIATEGAIRPLVVAEDWWIYNCLCFLLEPDFEVRLFRPAPSMTVLPPCVLVGWSFTPFRYKVLNAIRVSGDPYRKCDVLDGYGQPYITMFLVVNLSAR